MRIGIDARWIFREMSGIGVYTKELIRHLARIDRQNRYVLFFCDGERLKSAQKELAGLADNFTACLLNFGLFSISNQLAMPGVISRWKLDVFHSTNYMIPLLAFPRRRGKTACVTTIHDLIPLVLPGAAPRSRKTRFFPVYRRLMKEVVARSNLILTISSHSRSDLISHLNCSPERVLAVALGVSEMFQPAAAAAGSTVDARILRRNKIILWVGRQDPYKNLTGLIEAFAMLRGRYRGQLELRLVGAGDSRYPEPLKRIAGLNIADAVSWVGHVSDEQLVCEYQNANLLVMPSFYEGFGLPILEAMACGTPVVCGNSGALPETCGAAALQVDPKNTAGICEAMQRVLTDSRLAKDLTARGIKHAASYTWQATAQQTISAYEKAVLLK